MKVAPRALVACALIVSALDARAEAAGAQRVTEGSLETREGKETVPVPPEHTDVRVKID